MDYIISVTNKCNLKCQYCYEKRLNTTLGAIDDKTGDRIIKFINKANDANIVYLFGGEPLLYKDLLKKLITSIKAQRYVITSNGMLLDENFARWCSEHNTIINVSHDGKDCSARGIKAEELSEKVKMLLKYQPDTLLQLVYTEKTMKDLYENTLYFKDMGIKYVSYVMDSFLKVDDMDTFSDELKDVWEKVVDVEGITIKELRYKEEIVKGKRNAKCEICKKKLFINWDGKIYPCVQFQNLSDFQCGDIFKGIDTSKAEARYKNYSNMSERCLDCEISQYCDNSCACKKMSSTGGLDDISEAQCIEQQVLILTVLNKFKRMGKF